MMDVSQVASEIKAQRRDSHAVLRQLTGIARLEKNRSDNLPELNARLAKVRELLQKLEGSTEVYSALRSWIDDYQRELDDTQDMLRKQFGVQLEQTLAQQGLSLSGQYPDLRAGLFTIALDFDTHKAVLWYGAKQERLGECRLSVREVGKLVEKVNRRLGSNLDGPEFLTRVYDAYARVVGAQSDRRAPIIDVLAELAYVLQDARFRQDPRREHYKSYGRADFSRDLFRVRRPGPCRISGRRLHLVVATREHTKHRRDFLWIPDDETGRGTTYSHLQFEEETS